jgi:cysteine desulfurase
MDRLGADTLTLSAHKLGAAQGVGALLYGEGVLIARQIHGGGQERGLRAGTENLAGVAGFGAAAAASVGGLQPDKGLSEAIQRLTAAGAVLIGDGAPRVDGVLCIAAEGFAANLQVMTLDLEGVMISAGSACSSGKVRPSGVLEAMGLQHLAPYSVRASSGWATASGDWSRFADIWISAHARHRARHVAKKVA